MSSKNNIAKGGLGRGLDSLFSSTKTIEPVNSDLVKSIPLETLQAGVHQPRKTFTEENLEELCTSIKNQGIVQPLIVRAIAEDKKQNSRVEFEIIAGERRYRAAKRVNLTEVPVIIREYNDAEAMTVALIENLQREDLNVIEEAEAYYKLRNMHNLSQEDLAEKLGKSRSGVANALRLLSLPEYIKKSITEGNIKASHGRSLLAISDDLEQKMLFDAILEKDLNSRELEKAVEVWKLSGKFPNYIYAVNAQEEEQTDISPTDRVLKKTERAKNTFVNDKMQSLDEKLKDKFYKKASIRGDERKGSIKLNYKSLEELQYILEVLNIEHSL